MKNKTIIIICLISFFFFICSSTLLTIAIVIPGFIDFNSILVFSLAIFAISLTVLFILTTVLIGLTKNKKEKKYKVSKGIFIFSNTIYYLSLTLIAVLFFVKIITSVASSFLKLRGNIDLYCNPNNVISGELYLGDMVTDTDIVVTFEGKVDFTDNGYQRIENERIQQIFIDDVLLTKKSMIEDDNIISYYDYSSYSGIHDYRITFLFKVKYDQTEEFYGFKIVNDYYKKINTTMSDNYMLNPSGSLNNRTVEIFKQGTPYQHRYDTSVLIIRWVVFIIYFIIIGTYSYCLANLIKLNKNNEEDIPN